MATSTAAQPVTPGSVDDPRPPRKIGFRQQLGKWDVKLSPYLYISPFFILFAVVGLFPLLYTAWVSVHEWSLLGGQGEFIGWRTSSSSWASPTSGRPWATPSASSCCRPCPR